jgi:hypothetical protein
MTTAQQSEWPYQEWAAAYTQLGWSLVKLMPNSKQPVLTNWNSPFLKINTPDLARQAFVGGKNGMGLVHAYSRTGTVDIDHLEWAVLAFQLIGVDLMAYLDRFPRIKGGHDRDKFLFQVPANSSLFTYKLTWPHPTEKQENGRPKMVTVFELRCMSKDTEKSGQDVLPPSIHPVTGVPYEWREGHSPWDYPNGIPELDGELLAIWSEWDKTFENQLKSLCPWMPKEEAKPRPRAAPRYVQQGEGGDVIGKFNGAFSPIDVLERNGYKLKGKRWLCPSSSTKIPGVVLFEDGDKPLIYSHHGSCPLNDEHAHDAFSVLCLLEHNGDISKAIRAAASECGLSPVAPPDDGFDVSAFMAAAKSIKKTERTPIVIDVDVETGEINPPAVVERKNTNIPPALLAFCDASKGTPEHLLTLPVQALNRFVAWAETHTEDPQRQMSVQAALVLASTVAARVYLSESRNVTSTYYLVLAATGQGKDYGKSCVKAALREIGLGQMSNYSGVTSVGGVLSMLMESPAALQVIDEFGKKLELGRSRHAGHEAKGLQMLTEIYSDAINVLAPPSYAKVMQKGEEAKAVDRSVHCPCLTMMAIATHEQVFNSLTSDDVQNGFLNRWVVTLADDEPFARRRATFEPFPADLAAHMRAVRAGRTALVPEVAGKDTDLTKLANSNTAYQAPPLWQTVSIPAATLDLDWQFKLQLLADREAGRYAYPDLTRRWRENALRIATALAAWDNPERPVMTPELYMWARDYVVHYGEKFIERAARDIADSPFERLRNEIESIVSKPAWKQANLSRAGGARGMTEGEMSEASQTKVRSADTNLRISVLSALVREGVITKTVFKSASGRGKSREAYIHKDYLIDDEDESD